MKIRMKYITAVLAVFAITCFSLLQREPADGTPFSEPAVQEAEQTGQSHPADNTESKKSIEGEEPTTAEQPDIEIRNPIIFASYTFDSMAGDSLYQTLLFELVNGVYDSGLSMWDREWSGEFRFRTIEAEPGINIDSYDSGVISGQLQQAFAGPFQLYVKDYNGDGLMEFAITQFESASGGDTGRMFTLHEDGTVSELPVKNDRRYVSGFGFIGLGETDTGVFLIPFSHTGGSADLEQVEYGFVVRTEKPFRMGTDTGIYFMGDANDKLEGAAALEDIYLWDGKAFVLTEQRLIYE